jgi:peptide subunit release factor 1 (eRF1)
METVLVKCVQGENICLGVQNYITIDRVDLLFVDSNLNTEKVSIDYPNLKKITSRTTKNRAAESYDEPDCGRVHPVFTNIEIERINKKLEKLLSGIENIITRDKTSEIFLRHFALDHTNFVPVGYIPK